MDAKVKSILSWIIPIVAIVFLCMKDTEAKVKKHAATATTLFILDFGINIIYSFIPVDIPFFSTAVWALYVVCMVLGIVAASKDEDPNIPGLTNLAKAMFKKVF